MSVERNVDTAERTRHIRAAYRREGRPPTARQVAEHTTHSRDYYVGHGDQWDDILRAAGVPGNDDMVAEELRERYEDRYPWQEFIVIRARPIADASGIGASHVGHKLGQIADGERSPAALEEVTVSRVGMGSCGQQWRVE